MIIYKKLNWVEMRELVSSWIETTINYVSFVMNAKPDWNDKEILLELRALQKKVANATGPFLTYGQTFELQNKVLPFIINWNPPTTKQINTFIELLSDIARLSLKPEFAKISYNPLRILDENQEKFLLSSALITGLIHTIDSKKQDPIQMLALFYGLIATTETIHHYLFDHFKKSIKLFGLEDRYDVTNIFSISSKIKNKHGDYQTDVQSIRNVLAHFNFKFVKDRKKESRIILNLDSDKDKQQAMTFEQFKNFFYHVVFLIQSFLIIIYWQAAFATLRANFTKKPKCLKCKIGNLILSYKIEIYETHKTDNLAYHYLCENCGSEFPFNSKLK